MSLTELLGQLRSAGVRLRVEGSDLHVSAAKNALTPELRRAIQENKAKLIEALSGTAKQQLASMVALQPRRHAGPRELSFAQERLWFLSKLEPNNPFYNVPAALSLRGMLDESALERALDEIVRRHDALRTVFKERDGRPEQHVVAEMPLRLTRVDVGGKKEESEARARELADEEARQPFDLENGPLIRATLVTLSADSHLLLVTMHHIVSDGWSISVLLNELSQLYAAFGRGQSSPLQPLRLQYSDFSAWQRETLAGDSLEGLIRHWREVMADAPTSIRLPLDRKRPAVQSFQGGLESIGLGLSLTARLESLSRAAGGTVFMTMFAAFAALLSRYSGQTDLVIGTAIANRNHRDIEGMIGFFVNALPLRVDTGGDPSFSELIQRTQRVALDAYAHQDLPFETLVDELGIERDAGGNPLFQVLFAQQNTKRRVHMEGLEIEVVRRATVSAKFDLYLSVEESGEGLDLHLEYRRDLFEAATARRILRHYRRLLESACGDPSRPVSSWPLMEDDERERVLREFSVGAAPVLEYATVHEAFAARARTEPERTAVVFGDGKLSYRELDLRSNQLAHRLLRETGGSLGALIGVSLDRCLELPVVLLAILKAGGAYVALDPEYPADRIAQMLDDIQPSVVVTQGRLRHRLPASCPTLVMGSDEAAFADEPETAPPIAVGADDSAYVCFTSGTSGRPKGAAIPHRAVIRLAEDRSYADFGEQHTWMQASPVAFDASTLELWACLLNGGTLVVLPPGTPSLDDIAHAIRHHGVTAAWLTAGLFHLMADERIETLYELKLLLAGGDVLSPRHVSRVLARCPGITLVNGYGPTENTTFTCCHAMQHDYTVPESIPLGRPIAGTQVYILDGKLRPVPPGIPGELYTAGAGLACGYVNRAAQTAAAFVPNPYGARGERMYRTGDRARWRDDGTVEFLGRVDDQIKLRGFRVEPRETEAALAEHPSVDQCAVLAVGEGDEKHLAAYFVSKQESANGNGRLTDEQIGDWKTLYEQTYARMDSGDPTFNISGWNSSFDGKPIPEQEMREWLDATIARIQSLGAKRILEIGCGTGLLLFRLAPHCERYVATDFSLAAVERIKRLRDRVAGACELEVLERPANDLSGFKQRDFDLVILNSVIQYFPDDQYLRSVLFNLAGLVKPGGHIFVGDVRSLPLLTAFHASVELSRTQRSAGRRPFARTVRTRLQQERELAVDPHFFSALMQSQPAISLVQVQPKRGFAENELNRFRFDVTMHIGNEPPSQPIGWRDGSTLGEAEILRALAEAEGASLGFSEVRNARVAKERQIVAWMHGDVTEAGERAGELRDCLSSAGVQIERICRAAEQQGYRVGLRANACDPFCFDVAFARGNVALGFPAPAESQELTNNPLREKQSRELVEELRRFLQAKLPSWMIPSVFIPLDSLPLNAHGKVDRKSLPTIDRCELATRYEPPITATERVLVDIWSEVLGIDHTGVTDNFFELGGDSILAIQIVARARTAGLGIAPRDMFQYQSIRELANFADGCASAAPAPQGEVTGDAPMTAIQRWLIERNLPCPNHFNQSVLLQICGGVESRRIREAFARILSHHDALRLRWVGESRLCFAPVSGDVPFEEIEVADRGELADEIARLQGSLDLVEGPITRMARIRISGSDDFLFWTVHHMAVDGVSWRILLQDFEALCAGSSQLPPKTASFGEWAKACNAFAVSPQAEAELLLWTEQAPTGELRVDHPEASGSFEPTPEGPVWRALTKTETAAVVSAAGSGRGIQEVLLSASIWAIGQELGTKDSLLVDMESHGRAELPDPVDVSRTCGWFTALYPVRIELPAKSEWAKWTRKVAEALEEPSRNGACFGMLRYMGRAEIRERLAALPAPQVAFNYLGRFDQVLAETGPFLLTTESTEPNAAPGTPLAHALEINALIRNGRLEVRWDYCGRRFNRPTIDRIADRCVIALVDNGTVPAQEPVAAAVTHRLVSDFPEIDLSGSFLDEIEALAKMAGGNQ